MPFAFYIMAHPWHHALSSVKQFGGIVEDYLHLHHWMDETKMCFADFRHRALRHHVEGVSLGTTIFGELLTNTDGSVVLVRDVLTQHLYEDCGFSPSSSDWMTNMRTPGWFHGVHKERNSVYQDLCSRYNDGVQDKALGQLVDWFFFPFGISVSTTPLAGLFNSHSAGIFYAESFFRRPTLELSRHQMPIRVLGEAIVKAQYGKIPTVAEWAMCIQPAYWMIKTNKIERTLCRIQ